ncbi:MAG TPA: M48 family metalloprotease, partial [Dehalococcoidia bacterium]|nr:M48 family metalloprotease [Dehalococcoidia bacterium]
MPTAFAFGRTQRDGRVCVIQGLMKLLDKDELRAVLGQEMSHIRNRDMLVITLLSGIPLVMYWIVWSLMLGGAFGGRRQ